MSGSLGAEGECGVLVRRRGGLVQSRTVSQRAGSCGAVQRLSARGRGTVGDAVPAEQTVFALSALHRAVLGLAESRDRGEQAVSVSEKAASAGRSGLVRAAAAAALPLRKLRREKQCVI